MDALATSRLQQIAETVKAEHAEIEIAMRESLARAVKVGELLTEAKQLVNHGEWGKWIADNCQFSERTAQNYMRIHERFPELAKAQHVADLTYREAVGLLAEPKEEASQDEPPPKNVQSFSVIAEELTQRARKAKTLKEMEVVSKEFKALSKVHKAALIEINDRQEKLEQQKLLEEYDNSVLPDRPNTGGRVIPLETYGMSLKDDLFIGVNMWQKNFGGWCAKHGCWEAIETNKEWGTHHGRPGWDAWGLDALGAPRSCWCPVFCFEHESQTDLTDIVKTVRENLTVPMLGEL